MQRYCFSLIGTKVLIFRRKSGQFVLFFLFIRPFLSRLTKCTISAWHSKGKTGTAFGFRKAQQHRNIKRLSAVEDGLSQSVKQVRQRALCFFFRLTTSGLSFAQIKHNPQKKDEQPEGCECSTYLIEPRNIAYPDGLGPDIVDHHRVAPHHCAFTPTGVPTLHIHRIRTADSRHSSSAFITRQEPCARAVLHPYAVVQIRAVGSRHGCRALIPDSGNRRKRAAACAQQYNAHE